MRAPLVLTILLATTSARAADDPPRARTWYGWQIALSDMFAVGTFGAGLSVGSVELVCTGLSVYLLGPPLLHGGHGNPTAGAVSFTMRLGAPLLFGLGAYVATGGADAKGLGQIGSAAAGLLTSGIAALGAIALDIGVLAFKEEKTPRLTLLPVVNPDQRGLAISGAF